MQVGHVSKSWATLRLLRHGQEQREHKARQFSSRRGICTCRAPRVASPGLHRAQAWPEADACLTYGTTQVPRAHNCSVPSSAPVHTEYTNTTNDDLTFLLSSGLPACLLMWVPACSMPKRTWSDDQDAAADEPKPSLSLELDAAVNEPKALREEGQKTQRKREDQCVDRMPTHALVFGEPSRT